MKIVYTAFLLLVLGACSLTHPCRDSNLILGFTGFPNSLGFDTVYLRAYAQNGNFNQLVDTQRIVQLYSPPLPPGDTIYFWINGAYTEQHHYLSLGPGCDWEIYIPGIGRTFRISKIISINKTGKGRSCLNEIQSCVVDGKMVYPEFTGFGRAGFPIGYIVYIAN